MLQERGYRLTAPRLAVLEVFLSSQRVLSPLEVFERARERYPTLGLVTVYRTIEILDQLGVLWRVHQPQGCQGFVAAREGHVHLLVCQGCGNVEYFYGEILQDGFTARLAEDSGFQIKAHWFQLFGLCASCQE